MSAALRGLLLRAAIAGAAAVLAAPATGLGQATSPAAARLAALQPFDRWVGEWRGSGWSIGQAGVRTEFTLTETVQRRVGGTVLLIEGRGTATGNGAERVTHDGLVLLYYDDQSGRYRWNGHEVATGAVDVEPAVEDSGLSWSIPGGGGATVRFTIRFDERRWHEIGEVSADGRTWNPFMEINLLRQ